VTEAADQEELDDDTRDDGDHQTGQQTEQVRPPPEEDERRGESCRRGAQLGLGEVDDAVGPVDQGHADGHHRVETAQHQALHPQPERHTEEHQLSGDQSGNGEDGNEPCGIDAFRSRPSHDATVAGLRGPRRRVHGVRGRRRVVHCCSVRWTEFSLVHAARERSSSADKAVRTIEGFRRHRSGRNAALIAHFGFLSVFPLMLVFTTILGFVLQSRPSLREDIVDSAMAQLPFVGEQISSDPSKLRGNTVVLVLGLLAALWAGMKAFVALHTALDDVAEQPLDHRSNLFVTRLRALFGMVYIGGAQVATAGLSAIVGTSGVLGVSKVLSLFGAAVINAGVLALSYRWLCTRRPSWRSIAPGAIVGGVFFAALQLVGVAIVGRSIAKASPVYGTFASVIGLLSWLSLHSIIALGGAELNAALATDAAPRPPDCD
jgi:uncharacterized BrkB/YihY/UPF0761 family membrane protein